MDGYTFRVLKILFDRQIPIQSADIASRISISPNQTGQLLEDLQLTALVNRGNFRTNGAMSTKICYYLNQEVRELWDTI